MASETPSSVFAQANAHFVDEDYEEALSLYSKAIELDSGNVEFLVKRSACQHKLEKIEEALKDAEAALALDADSPKAHLRAGIAHFSMKHFKEAKSHLEKAHSLDPEGTVYTQWLKRTDDELGKMPKPLVVPMEPTAEEKAAQANMQPAEELRLPDQPKPALRFDWYQSLTHVNIDIYKRDCTEADAPVDIHEDMVQITAQLGEGREHQQHWPLWSKVVPAESKVEYLKPKISIRLKKAKQENWKDLEGDGTGVGTPAALLDDSVPIKHIYPTSAKKVVNWDEVAASVEEEKHEGDKALQALFQNIFKDGTEEQRRAMIKSFTESGGTVLSTNWEDVGKRKVECTPPSGVVPKKWDEKE